VAATDNYQPQTENLSKWQKLFCQFFLPEIFILKTECWVLEEVGINNSTLYPVFF